MNKAITFGIVGATVSVAMLAAGYLAGTSKEASLSSAASEQAMPRTQIESVVRDYLVANPEILTVMQTVLAEREQEEQRLALLNAIASSSDAIFNADHDGVVGNPQGTTTIVEFFDYNCGFCKRAHEDMVRMVAYDPDLRFVLKELPILGPDSQKAHVVSMAFRALAPEKYGEFHSALLMGNRATEETAIATAAEFGVDEAALREEMKNPAIVEAFSETYALASQLEITGTPSYVVGEEIVFGAHGEAVLKEKVALARARK